MGWRWRDWRRSLNCCMCCLLLCQIAVSYTHLDVYKRQVVLRLNMSENLQKCLLELVYDRPLANAAPIALKTISHVNVRVICCGPDLLGFSQRQPNSLSCVDRLTDMSTFSDGRHCQRFLNNLNFYHK